MEISLHPLYLLFGFLLIALTIFIGGYLLERWMVWRDKEKTRLFEERMARDGFELVWVDADDVTDGRWLWRKTTPSKE